MGCCHLYINLFEVWESCADHQPHSLIPAYLDPVGGHGQDGWI